MGKKFLSRGKVIIKIQMTFEIVTEKSIDAKYN